MRRKVTLKQIAKELDVSISTVSKSLRNSQEISEDTRLKVQAFAKLYNYKPNNIALSLKNKKTAQLERLPRSNKFKICSHTTE
jgi:LacI family transcriptional regulator